MDAEGIRMDKRIRIGSRKSRLAVIQTEELVSYIRQSCPDMEPEIVKIETTGDRRLDVALDKIGGKGLFVKEIDRALLLKEIELAVHSLKDMPMEGTDGLAVVAYSEREDARDAFVLPQGVKEWSGRGVIGCSSFRRRIQAERLFPEAEFRMIRGNVPTRLKKLDEGGYDALILAAAGLKRLGLEGRIFRYFSAEEILPAAGQGILAVQGRAGKDYRFLEGFGRPETAAAAAAERAFVRCLDGGCSSPVAAYAEVEGDRLCLRGLYYREEDYFYAVGEKSGSLYEAEQLGISLAREMEKRYGTKKKGEKIMGERDVARYVQERLFELQDLSYKEFHSKLMPTVEPERVIGVRMPDLRRFAKEFGKTDEAEEFLAHLPHRYYEENNLHGCLVSGMKDYGQCVEELDRFLPFVDNWATCDLISPKVFKKHLPELLCKIKEWIASEQTYVVRFGIGMLMSFYLDEAFDPAYPEMVSEVRSEEYYVNMMIAWYFATALAKQYDAALPFIEKRCLDRWTHNKAIQKAVESYRITDERKKYLRTLKIK